MARITTRGSHRFNFRSSRPPSLGFLAFITLPSITPLQLYVLLSERERMLASSSPMGGVDCAYAERPIHRYSPPQNMEKRFFSHNASTFSPTAGARLHAARHPRVAGRPTAASIMQVGMPCMSLAGPQAPHTSWQRGPGATHSSHAAARPHPAPRTTRPQTPEWRCIALPSPRRRRLTLSPPEVARRWQG